MNYLLIILQADYEALGVKSMLIATIIALVGVIAYLYKSKESALAEKDKQILQVIKEHQTDLKDSNKDMQTFVEKYHQFMQQITDVVNGRMSITPPDNNSPRYNRTRNDERRD